MSITQASLKDAIHYDPASGIAVWKNWRGGTAHAGKPVGTLDSHGYIQFKIGGKLRLLHRMIFLYMTGSIPQNDIDHIDGDRANNKWENLRQATRQQNALNRKIASPNRTGVSGVWFCERDSIYGISFSTQSGRKTKYAKDFFEAVCIRKSAEIKHGYHKNHGRPA